MRGIHWALLDKRRPVLVLTRESLVGRLSSVTVAPVSTTIHGLATELLLGPANGLGRTCAAKLDHVTSIAAEDLHEGCGWLLEHQELELHEALQAAFDLT